MRVSLLYRSASGRLRTNLLVVPVTHAVLFCVMFAQSGASLDKAREDLQAGNFEQAAVELKQELGSHPYSAEAHTLLAYANQKTDHLQDAIREYQAAIKLNPRSFVAHSNLGLLYLQQRNAPAAIEELHRAAALNPANPDIQYNLAVLLIDSGQAAQALKYLARVTQLQPARRDVRFQIIRANLSLYRLDEAKKGADFFIAGHPTDAAAVGQAFLDALRPSEAIRYLRNALSFSGNQEAIHPLLA